MGEWAGQEKPIRENRSARSGSLVQEAPLFDDGARTDSPTSAVRIPAVSVARSAIRDGTFCGRAARRDAVARALPNARWSRYSLLSLGQLPTQSVRCKRAERVHIGEKSPVARGSIDSRLRCAGRLLRAKTN